MNKKIFIWDIFYELIFIQYFLIFWNNIFIFSFQFYRRDSLRLLSVLCCNSSVFLTIVCFLNAYFLFYKTFLSSLHLHKMHSVLQCKFIAKNIDFIYGLVYNFFFGFRLLLFYIMFEVILFAHANFKFHSIYCCFLFLSLCDICMCVPNANIAFFFMDQFFVIIFYILFYFLIRNIFYIYSYAYFF